MKYPSLVSIDSGAKACACAGFRHRCLILVASVPCGCELLGGHNGYAADAVFEVPEHAHGSSADDLIRAAVAGARLAERIAGRVGTVTELRPREWKGSTPKPVCHLRMWPVLTAEEDALLGRERTATAIDKAVSRGAADRWQKPGGKYYRAGELPKVNGVKITHDILDAVAMGLVYLGRMPAPAVAMCKPKGKSK